MVLLVLIKIVMQKLVLAQMLDNKKYFVCKQCGAKAVESNDLTQSI